jgi:hypothetical protein
MGTRLQLQALLKAIPGVKKVYFQAPGTEIMEYPCIVYEKSDTFKRHANNNPYLMESGYLLTVMDEDPDSPIFKAVDSLPKCRFDRAFGGDQLNHQVFEIYF